MKQLLCLCISYLLQCSITSEWCSGMLPSRNQSCLVPLQLKQLSLDARHSQLSAGHCAESINNASGEWGNSCYDRSPSKACSPDGQESMPCGRLDA